MTVSSTNNKASYSANGSTTTFAYNFTITAASELKVFIRSATGTETLKTLTTHYTLTNVGVSGGGNVVFVTSPSDHTPADGETVVVQRVVPLTQATDYVENDPFPAATHEDALDKLTFIAQQLQEEVDRSLKLSVTNTMTSTEFTKSATDRANKIIAFDGSGELSVTTELGTFRGNWAASTSYNLRDLVKQNSASDSSTYKSIYICTTAHTSTGSYLTQNDTSNWSVLVDLAAHDTISELTDTNISSLASGHVLIYDGSDSFDNKAISGDATLANTGALTIAADAIESTMLNDNIISGQTAITSGLAATDELLFSDAGTIKRMDVSVLTDYYKALEVTETNKTLTSPKINEDVALTATATELNLLDDVSGLVKADFTKLAGVDSTATELNIVDGNTSVGTTTVSDGHGIVMNHGGTMAQTTVQTLAAYLDDEITAMPNLVTTAATTVGALNSGSITSGFGAIDNGSSAITTTGTVTYGSLSDGSITVTAFVDEDNMSSDSATLIPTQQSVKAYVDNQTLSLIDEDNMATDSASRPPSQQSVKAYIATQIATKDNSDEITEGSSNLYFTNARADARITNALIDEDDMSTNSATKIPSQQSVKAYVDAQKADMQFVLEDGDGTEVQITKDKEVKFVEGGGIDINWTDTDNGTDGDPFDLTFTINADQTDITSILATDVKIGEDDQTKIDFETNNQINFYADNTKRVTIDSTGLTVNSGSLETATIDYTDGDNAMTIADGGAVTFAQVPVFPDDTIETNDIQDNAVTLAKMAGLARGKLITGDSSGDPTALAIGTNGQYLKSDGNDLVWGSATVSGLACDDLTVGDSAVTISTSSGNITLDAQGADTDIIFKGTDGSADTTFLTIDGSDAGKLLPNNGIDLNAKELILDADADTSITADTDDQIDFKAGNVIRASVISTGLQIGGTAYFASPTLTLKDPDSGVGGGTIGGKIDFHTSDSTGTGVSAKIQAKYEDANGNTSVSFETGSGGSTSEKMNIASGGNVTISDGDLVIGTSGHGIDFSATANASGGSSINEILSDYEKGTFTGTMVGSSGSAGAVAGNAQTFTYVKIGEMVMINGSPALTNTGSYSGDVRITGLPFANGANHSFSIQCTWHNFNSRNDASANIYPFGYAGQSYLQFSYPDTNYVQWSAVGTGYYGVGGVYPTFG